MSDSLFLCTLSGEQTGIPAAFMLMTPDWEAGFRPYRQSPTDDHPGQQNCAGTSSHDLADQHKSPHLHLLPLLQFVHLFF